MSKFSEEAIAAAVSRLEAHRRHCEMHYDDTLMEIGIDTGLSDNDVLDLVIDPEVERRTRA